MGNFDILIQITLLVLFCIISERGSHTVHLLYYISSFLLPCSALFMLIQKTRRTVRDIQTVRQIERHSEE